MLFILTFLFIFFQTNISFPQNYPKIISYQGVITDNQGIPMQGVIDLTIDIIDENNNIHPSGFIHKQQFILQGGLFYAELGNLKYSNLEFPAIEGKWFLRIRDNKGTVLGTVPLYASVYALNIANDVVTSEKIKDGTIKSQDLSDLGATADGQVLTRKNNSWIGENIPKELPIAANEGDVLIYKNGKWQAEKLIIPIEVPIGTIVAFYGKTSQIPDGWLLCDGKHINETLYPELSLHLRNLYGFAMLPDLRGRFLRGAALNTKNDPDSKFTPAKYLIFNGWVPDTNNYRYFQNFADPSFGLNMYLQNSELIGSVQMDDFKKHNHTFLFSRHDRWGAPVYLGIGAGESGTHASYNATASHSVDFSGGSETRPKNVYVNFIIKAR